MFVFLNYFNFSCESNKNLNAEQIQAVSSILRAEPDSVPILLHGPPGRKNTSN